MILVNATQAIDLQLLDSLLVSLKRFVTGHKVTAFIFQVRRSYFDEPALCIRLLVGKQNVPCKTFFIRFYDLTREWSWEWSYPLGRLNRRQRPALLHLFADTPKTDRRKLATAGLGDIGHAERGDLAVKADPHITLDVVIEVFGYIAGVEDHGWLNVKG